MTYTFDANIVSDLYKDANGFRPSSEFFINWNSGTDLDKQCIWDNLLAQIAIIQAEEQACEQAAIDAFEEQVDELTSISNSRDSREQAIKWIVDSLELTDSDKLYGGAYVCYKLGLPYSYTAQFDTAIAQIDEYPTDDLEIYAESDAIAYGQK